MDATANRLVSPHMQASHTYLSLGVYFDREDVVLEDVGRFLRELAREKHDGPEHFLKMQNQDGGYALSQDDTIGNTKVVEKNVDPALLDLRALGPARADPQLRLPGGHALAEQVKFIEEMGGHWTNLPGWRPPGGAGRVVLPKLTCKHDEEPP
ncbi:ferritin light chain-like [Camelus ferus]|uniref:Ferritin n=2 Tax=Camelus TaxID=9836 RepID=A0A8B8T964_CAMFR|nr:ferritin light chain-like [Camelus ferus]XP_045360298.1 ferritin light chain-like [Camelus bactrianus]